MMMVMALLMRLFFLASHSLHTDAQLRHSSESTASDTLGAVQAVLLSLSQHECPVLIVLNHPQQITLTFLKELSTVVAPVGIAVFHIAADNLDGNETQTHLTTAVGKVREMGQLWHCLALVIVSDDPTFLAAFAHLSLRHHALRWSTRILVLTRLRLTELDGLHALLSGRNAILLRALEDKTTTRRVDVYVASPFSAPVNYPKWVASWTPNTTWTPACNLRLFPEKFFVFSSAPTLTLVIEQMAHDFISWIEDPDAPEGLRLVYTGHVDKTVRYFAKAMNFTYRYVLSPDRTFGTKQPDGSWTGMMGMVMREDVDFGAVPFMLSPVRAEAGDYTMAIWTGNMKIVGGLGGLEIDPWGFLLPLTPLVWMAILTALLGVLALLQVFPYCLPGRTLYRGGWSANTFSSIRIILQQDILLAAEWWWWERLVLGLWMLTTLVLAKSYSGNLMSLLAVRYVPQPFQTPRDVLNDPHVVMIWQKYSKNEQYLRGVESGVFREVADLEEKSRLKFHTQAQFPKSLDTLVRTGDHVLVDMENNIRSLVALDVSKKGSCDFYLSRDGFLPFSAAIMSQKTNPIIHGLNPRVMALLESGLFKYWAQDVSNFTRCDRVPKRLAFTSTLSTTNLWGVLVVLVGGLGAGLVVWCTELLVFGATV